VKTDIKKGSTQTALGVIEIGRGVKQRIISALIKFVVVGTAIEYRALFPAEYD
jgi:hypothetical protein